MSTEIDRQQFALPVAGLKLVVLVLEQEGPTNLRLPISDGDFGKAL